MDEQGAVLVWDWNGLEANAPFERLPEEGRGPTVLGVDPNHGGGDEPWAWVSERVEDGAFLVERLRVVRATASEYLTCAQRVDAIVRDVDGERLVGVVVDAVGIGQQLAEALGARLPGRARPWFPVRLAMQRFGQMVMDGKVRLSPRADDATHELWRRSCVELTHGFAIAAAITWWKSAPAASPGDCTHEQTIRMGGRGPWRCARCGAEVVTKAEVEEAAAKARHDAALQAAVDKKLEEMRAASAGPGASVDRDTLALGLAQALLPFARRARSHIDRADGDEVTCTVGELRAADVALHAMRRGGPVGVLLGEKVSPASALRIRRFIEREVRGLGEAGLRRCTFFDELWFTPPSTPVTPAAPPAEQARPRSPRGGCGCVMGLNAMACTVVRVREDGAARGQMCGCGCHGAPEDAASPSASAPQAPADIRTFVEDRPDGDFAVAEFPGRDGKLHRAEVRCELRGPEVEAEARQQAVDAAHDTLGGQRPGASAAFPHRAMEELVAEVVKTTGATELTLSPSSDGGALELRAKYSDGRGPEVLYRAQVFELVGREVALKWRPRGRLEARLDVPDSVVPERFIAGVREALRTWRPQAAPRSDAEIAADVAAANTGAAPGEP